LTPNASLIKEKLGRDLSAVKKFAVLAFALAAGLATGAPAGGSVNETAMGMAMRVDACGEAVITSAEFVDNGARLNLLCAAGEMRS